MLIVVVGKPSLRILETSPVSLVLLIVINKTVLASTVLDLSHTHTHTCTHTHTFLNSRCHFWCEYLDQLHQCLHKGGAQLYAV